MERSYIKNVIDYLRAQDENVYADVVEALADERDELARENRGLRVKLHIDAMRG